MAAKGGMRLEAGRQLRTSAIIQGRDNDGNGGVRSRKILDIYFKVELTGCIDQLDVDYVRQIGIRDPNAFHLNNSKIELLFTNLVIPQGDVKINLGNKVPGTKDIPSGSFLNV